MLSIAKPTMHRHVRIAFRFPFVNLAHITSRCLIAFLFPADVRTHSHHRHRPVYTYSSPVSLCQPLAIIFPLPPNTTRGLLFYVYDRQQDQVTSPSTSSTSPTPRTRDTTNPSHSPAPLRAPLLHDPIRCRSTVVIALFAYVIVSHDKSIVTSK